MSIGTIKSSFQELLSKAEHSNSKLVEDTKSALENAISYDSVIQIMQHYLIQRQLFEVIDHLKNAADNTAKRNEAREKEQIIRRCQQEEDKQIALQKKASEHFHKQEWKAAIDTYRQYFRLYPYSDTATEEWEARARLRIRCIHERYLSKEHHLEPWWCLSDCNYAERFRLFRCRDILDDDLRANVLRYSRFEQDAIRFSSLHSWYKHLKPYEGTKFYILLRLGSQDHGYNREDAPESKEKTVKHLHLFAEYVLSEEQMEKLDQLGTPVVRLNSCFSLMNQPQNWQGEKLKQWRHRQYPNWKQECKEMTKMQCSDEVMRNDLHTAQFSRFHEREHFRQIRDIVLKATTFYGPPNTFDCTVFDTLFNES